MRLQNGKDGKGSVYYGLHFYPGVAEYAEPNKEPFRVFLNEDTLRSMDPTFAGRPVFVMHVDGVDNDTDELRKEADGWVVESFFNEADGKHWVKFLAVTERAENAIRRGMRLSNCYVPKAYGAGGLWNGVSYAKEITGGEYEHLAIVPNPRYEESVILTPEQFKDYCEEKKLELKRLANANNGEGRLMAFSLFKRQKVEKLENAGDLEQMSVMLPKSGVEVTLVRLINDADERAVKVKNKDMMANGEDHVDMGEKHGGKMTVNDMIKKHQAMYDELEKFKAQNVDLGGEEAAEEGGDADHVLENDEDAEAKKKAEELAAHEEKEMAEKKKNELDDARRKAKEKADRLRNAGPKTEPETAKVEISADKVARGKSRYGS